MQKRVWFIAAIFAAVSGLAPRCGSAQQRDLEIAMRLTKTRVLLGEPVWVDVTVTNRTKRALEVDMGDACFGNTPLEIAIPEAERGSGQHGLCGMAGGDCWARGPYSIDPGKSISVRYVISGNFRITHPGTYHVFLQKKAMYAAVVPGTEPSSILRDASEETAKEDVALEVRPADRDKLLFIEQYLARVVNEPYKESPPPPFVDQSPSDMDALRNADDALRALDYANYLARASVAEGLSDYPAPGMEPIFDNWLVSQAGLEWSWYGLQALYRMSTPESRRLLAQAAEPPKSLYKRWRSNLNASEAEKEREFGTWRGLAIRALVDMGDRSYLPLIEKLADDRNEDVRAQAVLGLGLLGGASELPRLTALIRHATDARDRGDAFQAIGYAASLDAVPELISLLTVPGIDEPAVSDNTLTTITHHSLPFAKQRSPAEYQALWSQWWEQNRATARAYGPFDCTGSSFHGCSAGCSAY